MTTKTTKPAKKPAKAKRTPPTRAKADFQNDMVIKLGKEKPNGQLGERVKLLKSGQTVAQALVALRDAGYRRRRASLRKLRKVGILTIG